MFQTQVPALAPQAKVKAELEDPPTRNMAPAQRRQTAFKAPRRIQPATTVKDEVDAAVGASMQTEAPAAATQPCTPEPNAAAAPRPKARRRQPLAADTGFANEAPRSPALSGASSQASDIPTAARASQRSPTQGARRKKKPKLLPGQTSLKVSSAIRLGSASNLLDEAGTPRRTTPVLMSRSPPFRGTAELLCKKTCRAMSDTFFRDPFCYCCLLMTQRQNARHLIALS